MVLRNRGTSNNIGVLVKCIPHITGKIFWRILSPSCFAFSGHYLYISHDRIAIAWGGGEGRGRHTAWQQRLQAYQESHLIARRVSGRVLRPLKSEQLLLMTEIPSFRKAKNKTRKKNRQRGWDAEGV